MGLPERIDPTAEKYYWKELNSWLGKITNRICCLLDPFEKCFNLAVSSEVGASDGAPCKAVQNINLFPMQGYS